MIVFGVLLAATLAIHVIGYFLRQRGIWSRVLLFLGFFVVACMAWQFHSVRQDAAKLRLDVTKITAPRSLSVEQAQKIKDKIAPFSGQLFGMVTYWQDNDLEQFTKHLGDDALIPGGWIFVPPPRGESIVGVIRGIIVYVSDTADNRTKAAAAALVSALNEEDIAAQQKPDATYTTMVEIMIGIK